MSKKTRNNKEHKNTQKVTAEKVIPASSISVNHQVAHDLRKTIILTLFLFALEFLIFYANLK